MHSGASTHITHDPNAVEQVTNNNGKDKMVEVGNGNRLTVTRTGSSILPCKNKTLSLSEVLYTPQISKNLLNVSKLTNDNNVLVEFDSIGCYVKDK